jgi:hypothetical protein
MLRLNGNKILKPYLVVVLFLVLYAWGASNNSSLDAWGYASEIERGEELLQPHHLLYNVLGYCWVHLMSVLIPTGAIGLLKLLNALFASLSLLVLNEILTLLKVKEPNRLGWILLVAGSWGIMRFATDNEAYIVPIFFSLLGSFFFLKGAERLGKSSIFWSGFFSAFAILFHQVMVFWWVALAIGVIARYRKKGIVPFFSPALVAPVAYIAATWLEYGSVSLSGLVKFGLLDYYNGTAKLELNGRVMLMWLLSMFRSFFQVHGYMFTLFKQNWTWWVAGISAIALVGCGLVSAFTNSKIRKSALNQPIWIFMLAALLQILFALFAGGNAEFMVMLPALLAIILSVTVEVNPRALVITTLGMLTWNTTFGLIPLKYYTLDGSGMVVNNIIANPQPSKSAYLLHSLQRIENELEYRQSKQKPILLGRAKLDSQQLADSLTVLLANGFAVYTDDYRRPQIVSREYIIEKSKFSDGLWASFRLIPCDSVATLTGCYPLYRVLPPAASNPPPER